MNEKPKIKHCLFCSVDDAEVIRRVHEYKGIQYYVECQCCESRGPICYSEATAIQDWNEHKHAISNTECNSADILNRIAEGEDPEPASDVQASQSDFFITILINRFGCPMEYNKDVFKKFGDVARYFVVTAQPKAICEDCKKDNIDKAECWLSAYECEIKRDTRLKYLSYGRRPYHRVFIQREGGGFLCKTLEFIGCESEGDTIEEAYESLRKNEEIWINGLLLSGIEPPMPWKDACELKKGY